MRPVASLVAALLLAGCTAAAPGRSAGTASAGAAAFTVDPKPAPTQLAPRVPPSRPNRAIERMSSQDLAGWILTDRAHLIAAAEISPARWGVITYAYLWQTPRALNGLGICQVDGWGVGFQVENERSLTPEQSINPPLRPAWTVPERRFRASADCASPPPYWRWSEAPSAEAMAQAVKLIEDARSRARAGSPGLRLACTQIRVDEASGASSDQRCADARGVLRQLTPDLIKRVRSSQCQGDISRESEGDCVAIEYHDPAAPGTFSLYMVRIAGRKRADAVEIVEGMLPPQ